MIIYVCPECGGGIQKNGYVDLQIPIPIIENGTQTGQYRTIPVRLGLMSTN